MPKDTPSMAKNKMRRSLGAILDPHPSRHDVDRLWAYFNSSCAYCGVRIPRESRGGHLDHVVAASLGGGNSIHNFVLSCARCNGDEKREAPWESFLADKCPHSEVASQRRGRIFDWLSHAPPGNITLETMGQYDAIVSEALASFDAAVRKVRSLRSSDT
jgi:hypothetical protein